MNAKSDGESDRQVTAIDVPKTVGARLEALLAVDVADFRVLTLAAGLDPLTSFRGKVLRDINFGTSDLSGFSFADADLGGCDFRMASVGNSDFRGARLDGVFGLEHLSTGKRQAGPARVFISHANGDQQFKQTLSNELWSLEQRGVADILHYEFRAGEDWPASMTREVDTADVVVLLISPDFVASKSAIMELGRVMKRHASGAVEVIPVALRSCDWRALPLDGLQWTPRSNQWTPRNKRAIADWADQAEAWRDVCQAVEAAAERVRSRPAVAATDGGVIHNLPPRNVHFLGRGDLLQAVDEMLNSQGDVTALAAISGLGGMGKSQLALEYAWSHLSRYRVLWWLRAGNEETLVTDLADLAQRLGIAGDAVNLHDQARAGLNWLAGQRDWLLVYDDLADEQDVAQWSPPTGGHALITSRSATLRNVPVIMVENLTAAEATTYLHQRLGRADPDADALAAEVGYLPLALELAAAYTRSTGCSLGEYLVEYRRRVVDMQTEQERSPIAVAGEQVLKRLSETAAALATLFAFLAPEAILLEMLIPGAAALPAPLDTVLGSELAVTDAVDELRHASLVAAGTDGLTMHRLVQEAARNRLTLKERERWAAAAAEALLRAFPFDHDDVATWPPSGRLLPHLEAAAGHAETVVGQTAARLLNIGHNWLQVHGFYPSARTLGARALALAEQAWPENAIELTTFLNDYAGTLHIQGDLVTARHLYERAVRIDEAALGPNHPQLGIRLNNLGSVLHHLGDQTAARSLFEQALRIHEAVLGPDHPQVANDLSNLGRLLHDSGDRTAARALFERALHIHGAALGPDHPRVANDLTNLGRLLYEEGDQDGARDSLERALHIHEAMLGPYHPEVAIDHSNLGWLLRDLGDENAARLSFERAATIATVAFGADHPTTQNITTALAHLTTPAGL